MSYQCQSSRTILFTDEQPDCRDLRSWDFGDGTIETNAAPDISHTFLQEGTYTITLSAEHSCLGTEITVISVNILSFNAEINPVTCSGTDDGSIIIQPVPGSLANTQINWLTPGLSGFSISGIGPGQYVFQLTANRSCAVSDTILMPDRPNAPQPVIGPDRTICPGSAVLLKTALSYTQYLWSDGSIGSSLLVNDPGNYWLQVTDSDGCSGRDSVYLELECLTEPVFPSAFTPNGDLKNDYFQIYCGSIIIEDWYVMDRWGQRLFHSTDPLQVWEGDDVPEGVYVCLVRYRDTDDNLIEKTGRITLIR
ncbi:MAG: PKD domain-containing protein [Bacteroidota bacterium]